MLQVFNMVSFQRMKDEIDGLGNHISSRVPVIGKSGCFTMVAIGVFVLFIIGMCQIEIASESIIISPLEFSFISQFCKIDILGPIIYIFL